MSNAGGPRDPWWAAKDDVAVAGKTLRIRACINAEVGDHFPKLRLQGIEVELVGEPPRVIMEDSPPATSRGPPLLNSIVSPRLGRFIGNFWDAARRTSGFVPHSWS